MPQFISGTQTDTKPFKHAFKPFFYIVKFVHDKTKIFNDLCKIPAFSFEC